jgi:hypothetical protein
MAVQPVIPGKDREALWLRQIVDAGIALAYSQKGAGIAAVWATDLRPHVKFHSGPSAQIATWAVNSSGVHVNLDWCDGTAFTPRERPMAPGEIVFLLAHETMHEALGHQYLNQLMGVAQDAVINHVLLADGIGQYPTGGRRGITLADLQPGGQGFTLPSGKKAVGYNGPVDSYSVYEWLAKEEKASQPPPPPPPPEEDEDEDEEDGDEPEGDEGEDGEKPEDGEGNPSDEPGEGEGDEPGEGESEGGEGEGEPSDAPGNPGQEPGKPGNGGNGGEALKGCAPKGHPSDAKDGSDAKREDDAKIRAEKARVTIREASNKAGTGTAIASLLAPRETKASIRQLVKRAFTKASEAAQNRSVPTYARATRRGGIDASIITAGRVGTEGRVAFIGDVSGSLGEDGARTLIGFIASCAKEFPEVKVYLVAHTDEVVFADWMKQGGDAEKAAKAASFTGGTDFKPAYDAVREAGKFDVAVHFTDGYNFREWPESPARELIIGVWGGGQGMTTPPENARMIPVEPIS